MSSFTSAIEAGRAFLKVVVDDTDVAKGFERVQAKLNTIGQKMQKWGAISSAVSATVVGTIGAAAKSFATAGAAIDDMTKRTGFSAKAIGELSYAAAQSGTDIKGLERAVKGMEKFMLGASRGGAGFTQTLDELGVSLDQIQGQTPERQFQVLSEAIAGVDDPTQRAALAMKIFSKSGADLLPLLVEGKGGIAALRAEAERLGLVMSEEDVAAAAKFDDTLARLGAQAEMAFNQIGAAVAGPLTDFGDKMSGVMASVIEFIKANPNLVTAIAAIGTAAAVATAAVAALGTALTIVTAHPIILGITAIGLAIAGIYVYFDEITAKVNEWRWALEKIAPPGGMIDLLLKLTRIRQLQIDIAANEKKSPMFVGEDGKVVGGPNGKFSNGRTIGGKGFFSNGRNLDSPIPAEPWKNPGGVSLGPGFGSPENPFGNLMLGQMLGMTMPGKGGAKLNRRLKGWASSVADTANFFNPLAGLGIPEMAGDAKRFGKRVIAGKVKPGDIGDGLGKMGAELLGGIGRFFSGNSTFTSSGTFSAGAVGALQSGSIDQQILDVNKQQLAALNKLERKDDPWKVG